MKLEEVLAIEKKVCTRCKRELPREKFGLKKDTRWKGRYSLNSQCNDCRAEKKRKYYWSIKGEMTRPGPYVRTKLWHDFKKTAEANGVTAGQALEIALRGYIERTYRRRAQERSMMNIRRLG